MLLQLDKISKSYGQAGESNRQVVLEDLSLEVENGETIAILGPSGSGKSTLLNIIGTLDYPDSGSVIFNGQALSGLKGDELDHFRNREIGLVFQSHHLLPQCNVMENVLIPTLAFKGDGKESRELAGHLLNRVGLWAHRHKRPAQLSGGECQRVAVVRAMINRPSLILADEPTGALDSKNVGSIAELLLKLNHEDGVTMILVTHSRSLAAAMSGIYELKEGKLQRQ